MIKLKIVFIKFFVLMSKSKTNNQENVETLNAKDFLEMQGEVLELMPAATFRVKLDSGHEILAHLSGKMRMHRIRLLPGDRVHLQMSPYDLTKGRIIFRY
ncbi:MAG: Translation initiation factor IF-1 [Parcubacteria group bacterium ADurb.Bin115]|nr:MAG: Translation initiation factor IF-1 [Parcubacteria group bacterium ADurb.Bin115]